MRIIVHSVPGTGTRFTEEFLQHIGLVKTTIHKLEKTTNSFTRMHTLQQADYWFLRGAPSVVSPLRDPYLSYITRNHLMEHVRGLDMQTKWVNNWRQLRVISERHATMFLPIDRPDLDRTKLLQSVAKYCGGDYREFEWRTVGSSGTNSAKGEYLKYGTIGGEKPTFLDEAYEWYDSVCRTIQLEEVS